MIYLACVLKFWLYVGWGIGNGIIDYSILQITVIKAEKDC